MNIKLKKCLVRSWHKEDASSLTEHANNRNIWINLRDGFPHPYKISDAIKFIETAQTKKPETIFCIDKNDEAIGAIGYGLNRDVEKFSAEIGYWLAEKFWGQGIMTEVLKSVTQYAIKTHDLVRIYALPYGWNQSSFRVLEKAGYVLEGRMRHSAFKDGKFIDQLLYAYVSEKI